jgi:drug/metabolite transporter (DMT)-like permease
MSLRNRTFSPLVLAIIFMIASTACFSAMSLFIRFASTDLHTTEIVFLRNLFSVLLMMPWVFKNGIGVLRTTRLKSHVWRGTVGVIGMQLWFYCVVILPLNEATALSFTAPILTTIFAMLFLGEQAGFHRWAAILMGFVGALIIIRPDPDNMNWMLLLVPCATSMWAIASIFVKSLTTTEPPNRIVFYMALVMTVWSAPAALYHWRMPDLEAMIYCFAVAATSTVAHLCLVRAYARADIAFLMPFDFSRLVFTAIFAYFVFGEVSDYVTWAGAAVIVASAAYISYREALHKKRLVGEEERSI